MPRPIYADSLKEEINSLRVTITVGRLNGKKYFSEVMEEYQKSIFRIIDEQPTADVAPRSEVEELIRENESLAKTVNEASELIHKLRSKVKKSKTEIAREIFEEIERAVEDAEIEWGTIWGVKLCISELKKKYTEVERLEAYNENLKTANAHVLGTLQDEIEKAKTETIKEFADRLKYEMQNIARVEIDGKIYFLVGESFIDNIAETMKED